MNTSNNQQLIAIEAVRAIIDSGNVYKHRLEGNSMFPFLTNGDLAFISKFYPTKIQKGEILVFQLGNRTVVHRLITSKKIQNEVFYRTKGDSCYKFDPWIKESDIIGKLTAYERKGKIYNLDKYLIINKLIGILSPYFPLFYYLCRFPMRVLRKIQHLSFLS